MQYFLFLTLISLFFSLLPQSQSDQPEDHFKISVNVDLVLLNVSVEDDDGEFVSGLSKSSFQVLEDDVPQEISVFQEGDVPITVGIVLDKSGSMKEKFEEVVTAALSFVRLRNPEDEFFVVNFNQEPSLGLPENTPFTTEREKLRDAMLRSRVQGQTALYDALAMALKHIEKGVQKKRALLVISDGGDNLSKHRFEDIVLLARKSDAIIYGIVIYDPDAKEKDPKVLKKLAKEAGGIAYFPKSVQALPAISEAIANDLRRQYTLGYTPGEDRPKGTFRKIKVLVNAPGKKKIQVRTRSGYLV